MNKSYESILKEMVAQKFAANTNLPSSKPHKWSHKDFIDFSEEIYMATKQRVSVSTLKRIFNKVKSSGITRKNTLTILAQYLGFVSYIAFQKSIVSDVEAKPAPVTPPPAPKPNPSSNPNPLPKNNVWLYAAFIFGLCITLLGCFALYSWYMDGKSIDHSNAIFSTADIEGDYPHAVTLYVNLGGMDWEEHSMTLNRTKIRNVPDSIRKNGRGLMELAGNLKLGVNYLALLHKDTLVRKIKVMVRSDDWFIQTQNRDKENISLPFKQYHDGMLTKPVEFFTQRGIPLEGNPRIEYTMWNDFKDTDLDNFILETRVMTHESIGGSSCRHMHLTLTGSEDYFDWQFAMPACKKYVFEIMTSKHKYRGNAQNYEAIKGFLRDLSEWTDIRLEVKNKHVSVYANERLIFEDSYFESAGKLKGIKYRFRGNGAIDHIRLKDWDGNVKYENEFGGEPGW